MSAQPQTATLATEIPTRLLGEMQALVAAGWFRNLDELVGDALRRYLETHRGELMEDLVRADVDWGLHGDD